MGIPVKTFNFLKIEDNETNRKFVQWQGIMYGKKSSDLRKIKITTMRCLIDTGIYNYLCANENYLTDKKNLLKRKS